MKNRQIRYGFLCAAISLLLMISGCGGSSSNGSYATTGGYAKEYAAADTVTAQGEFDGEEPMVITFSYDAENNVVWTENGLSTTLEYSFYTD